jgi:hypothetical protein
MCSTSEKDRNRLHVRLHKIFVHLFIQRFYTTRFDCIWPSSGCFTCILTSVFLLFLPTLVNVYIWRYDVIAPYDKINYIIKTYKLRLLKLLKLLKRVLYITIAFQNSCLVVFLHVHSYIRVITHVERLSNGLLILRCLNY